MDREEKKYRRLSSLYTALIQVAMLLLIYFLVAWREPFPPIPEYGIELNFGLVDTGSGESQVSAPTQQPQTEPSPTEEQPTNSESDPPETVPDDSSNDNESLEANQDSEAEPDEQEVQETESPDIVSPPADQQSESPLEEESQQEIPEEVVDENQEEPSEATDVNPSEEIDDVNASQGETTPTGDQGDPEGEIDERALYGNLGSQDGASLQMTGWVWDFKPEPKDDSQESGKIVYKITIDDEGYITGIQPVTSTVSPAVEQLYRRAVEQLTFSKTSDYRPAPTSSGTITFIIKTR
ncbi:MAG: hypothetical protein KI790_12685 [Cyclobacteriaceae bacterium]|nr:hypothetical protein [Cyclobacteriaceae bacterium HetDA_MAG_MS6]